ncbi:MAG TPA: hypothetical protein VH370_02715 [Humisphaera sp.]|nr:hypothetical protein [Humisphaera sp.]
MHIESVVPSAHQPQESDPATIWYDDFNGPEKPYGEKQGELDSGESLGGSGKSLLCNYPKGSQGIGNRKIFFGDSPDHRNVVRRGEKFDEIYWRIYVKHQPNWIGGGEAKLSRATSLTSDRWTQAMIAHVWSGQGDSLTLDPASGVVGDRIVTTRYNDFANLHWLGNKPSSEFQFSSPKEGGWWVCVEAYAKLNTPGEKDGINKLWIDGKLATQRERLNWRGNYTGHGINAVYLEAYWNQGSPVDQKRWIDNFVVSTKPIGPVTCPRNPVLIRSQNSDPPLAWQAELAMAGNEAITVWRSKSITGPTRVTVDAESGEFLADLSSKQLAGSSTYVCRLREATPAGTWAEWTNWHQAFLTEK